MATKDTAKKAGTGGATDLTAGDFHTFALEYDEDRTKLRWAIGIAVAFHVVLFLIKLPDIIQAQTAKAEKPKVYVVQQIRFKPPQQQQEQQKVEVRRKKVPIPDPTPDEPEPIRVVDEVQQPEVAQAKPVGAMDRCGYGRRRCRALRGGASARRSATSHSQIV